MRNLLFCLCLVISGVASAQTYRILGPAKPLPHEATAMQELRDYLARRINGDLTIGGRKGIVFQVGDTELAKANNLLSTQLPEEQWHIKSFGNQVLLNGGGTRGALYAVYHFLEDFCDIHWWSEYEDYVPTQSSLELPSLDKSGKPAFMYRDIYRTHYPADKVQFAVRIRLNRSGDVPIPAAYGGSFNYGPPYHCHTFNTYVPAAQYLESNPEYFSLVGGKRVGGQTKGQLCLTNEALKPIFLQKLLAYIHQGEAHAKAAGVPAPRIYDVSENDNIKHCECDKCMAFVKKHGRSSLCLDFVNWLADEVAKVHPQIYISTFAYQFNQQPPTGGIRAAANVIVKLSDTDTNQAASILEEENKFFKEYVEQCKHYADNLFIWDYAITYKNNLTDLPFASEFHYGDLHRHYRGNNVRGVFWEHEAPHLADMYELKVFLQAKLLEDPDQDVNALINLFMDRYYGPAGPHILKYRQLVDAARKRNRGVVPRDPKLTSFDFLTDTDIATAQAIFEQAEAAVRDDTLLFPRVRRARNNLDRLTCRRHGGGLCYRNKDGVRIFKDNQGILDSGSAGKRLQESWPAWIERYAAAKRHYARAKDDLTAELTRWIVAPVLPLSQVPVVAFAGRSFYDFNVGAFLNQSASTVSLVSDPESPCGYAFRSTVSKGHLYNLPFAIGFCDIDTKAWHAETFKEAPPKQGYNWYELGKVTIPKNSYIFTSRAWTTQLPLRYNELIGNTYDIWVSAKLSGPQFYPGTEGPEYIWVDRIILLEP